VIDETRGDRAAALLLGAGVFAVDAWGACRTIYVGDSGELVTAVSVLGIPHPSGYPLYVLLGKLFTLLVPLGSNAFRMSLFSAFFAGATTALLYLLARRLECSRSAALTGALLLAVAPSFWAEANVQRVYTLNAFFVVLVATLALRWEDAPSDRRMAGVFFACGLGAANHTYMAILAFAFSLFVLVRDVGVLRRSRAILLSGAAFALGLFPYLYLPIRARMSPPLDWGDPQTLGRFLAVVSRKDFWGRKWIRGPEDLVPIGLDWLKSFAVELSIGGAVLALFGIFFSLRSRRRRAAVLFAFLGTGGNVAAMALHGSRSDIFIWHRYYIPAYVFAALLAALGADALVRLVPPRLGWALLALPLVLLVTRFPDQDRHRYRIGDSYARTLLESLPPGSHLASSDDNVLFATMYLHLAEGLRPDVDLILQGVGGPGLVPLRFEPDTDPVFFAEHPNWRMPELLVVPDGLAFRIMKSSAPMPPPRLPIRRLEGEDDPRVPKDYLTTNVIGNLHYMLGSTLERADWPAARREYEEAARAAKDNDVLFFNLGLIFEGNGLLDDSLRFFTRSREINPREIPSATNPRAEDRLNLLTAEKERVDALMASLAPDVASLRGAARHRRMAELLRERGEDRAARGEERRAAEVEAGMREEPL
jgi:tetratricopeptide (TPR) repeat protein